MVRVIVRGAFVVAMYAAQSPTARSGPPQFEAAAIHPANPNTLPSGCLTTPGFMRCANVTLKRCIVGAYGVLPNHVLGGPGWAYTDRFQITARSNRAAGDKELMAMLQTLLADRFKLVLHREFRKGEAMVLQVARNGPKLQPASGVRTSWRDLHGRIEATRITMGEFAEVLSRNLNLPVTDRTGLTGAFSLTVHWNPDKADALERDEALGMLRSELSAAVERQLGLTLRFRRMPIEMLVIDHAEKPSGN